MSKQTKLKWTNDVCLFHSLIRDGHSLDALTDKGLARVDLNEDGKQLFDYIADYVKKYDKIPDWTTVRAENEIEGELGANNPLPFWIDRIKEYNRKKLLLDASKKIEDFREDSQFDKMERFLLDFPLELAKHDNQGRKPKVVTALEIMNMDFPEPKWAVPDFLPEGLTLLGGKPKVGKSILALNLGLSISAGRDAFKKIKVEQGRVFYLTYEDPLRRIKERMKGMRYVPVEGTPFSTMDHGLVNPRLQISTEWPQMGCGGIRYLEGLIKEHPDLRLIIIDPWIRFKPTSSGRNQSMYQVDYNQMSPVKQLADRSHVAILLIHHLRKEGSEDDPMDQMQGTLGGNAVPDALIALKPTGRGHSTLHIRGREIADEQYAFQLGKRDLLWKLLGKADNVEGTTQQNKLYDVVKDLTSDGSTVSPKELKIETKMRLSYIKKTLKKLVDKGQVDRPRYGQYRVAER